MPVLVFGGVFGVYFVIRIVSDHPALSTGILGALVLMIALIIYVKSKTFADTALAFILGLFTVFTVSWDHEKVLLFGGLFCAFMLFVFLISSIRIAAEKESVLTQAASYYDVDQHKQVYKRLENIVDTSSHGTQLDVKQRADIVRLFCFRKVLLDEMAEYLRLTNIVFTITDVTPEDCAEFVISVKRLASNEPGFDMTMSIINTLLELPFKPSESLSLLRRIGHVIPRREFSIQELLDEVKRLCSENLGSDEVIERLRQTR